LKKNSKAQIVQNDTPSTVAGESLNCFSCDAVEGDTINCQFEKFFCPGRDSQCATVTTTTTRGRRHVEL